MDIEIVVVLVDNDSGDLHPKRQEISDDGDAKDMRVDG